MQNMLSSIISYFRELIVKIANFANNTNYAIIGTGASITFSITKTKKNK